MGGELNLRVFYQDKMEERANKQTNKSTNKNSNMVRIKAAAAAVAATTTRTHGKDQHCEVTHQTKESEAFPKEERGDRYNEG